MKIATRLSLVALALSAATPALAHTGPAGHDHGLIAGFMHPIGGLDHLLAMLAVGVWSALAMHGNKVWIAPAVFVLAMVAGAGLGAASVPLPMVETGIAASVFALGLLILTRVTLPVTVGAILTAAFALFHGHAHGAEATGSLAAYIAGFAVMTAALHVAGIALGHGLVRLRHAPRALGGALTAVGAYLLAAS